MNTTIVFNADAAQFTRSMEQMKKSTLDVGDGVTRTKDKIKEALRQKTAAAVAEGKTQQELDRMQMRGAQDLASVTESNYKKIEAAIDRRMAKERAATAELAQLTRVQAQSSGHGFTDRMAVSSLVRTANGNPGIRTIENSLTLIPGLAEAAQGLAPLIGYAGLTGLLVEMGVKGYEAFEKVTHAAELTRQAFEQEHDRAQISIDDKEIENQKLQDQIDKLSHHPNNGVALALLEAKKMADQLLVSLEADQKQLEALFKEHDTGVTGSILSALGFGPQSTGTQQEEIKSDLEALEAKLRHEKAVYIQALKSATDDPGRKAATLAYNKAVHDDIQGVIDPYQREDARFAGLEAGHWNNAHNPEWVTEDHSQQRANLQGTIGDLKDLQYTEQLDASIYDKNNKVGGLKQDEGENKADEQRMRNIETQFAKLGATLPEQALRFWSQFNGAFNEGSVEYLRVVEQIKKYTDEFEKSLHRSSKLTELIKKFKDDQQKADDLPHLGSPVDLTGSTPESSRQLTAAYGRAVLAGAELQAQAAKARVQIDQSDGSISRLAADQQLAAIATQLHAQRIADLNSQMEGMRKDPQNSYNPILDRFANDKTQGQYLNLKVELDKESSTAAIEQMQETAKLAGDTWQGALKDANARWVQDARDTAQQVVQLYQQAISGLNQNLVNSMFGDKTDWSGMFKGIGKTIAGDGLKHLEAAGLGAFGVAAKADGSKANPYYVIDASKISGSFGGAAANGAASFFGTPSGSSSTSGSKGGFLSTIASFASAFFGGGKALGGPVMAGVSYDVGEFGRERFTPTVPGVITPNNQVRDAAAHYTMYVADGVTPEQMHQHVTAALQQFHPKVVRDAYVASRDAQARMPSSRS